MKTRTLFLLVISFTFACVSFSAGLQDEPTGNDSEPTTLPTEEVRAKRFKEPSKPHISFPFEISFKTSNDGSEKGLGWHSQWRHTNRGYKYRMQRNIFTPRIKIKTEIVTSKPNLH